jgi:hypothetical protein
MFGQTAPFRQGPDGTTTFNLSTTKGQAAAATLSRRTAMFDIETASNGVKFALLEGQLLARESIARPL